MSELSVEQMRAAIFARACDLDHEHQSGVDAAVYGVDTPYNENNEPDHEARERLVADALNKYWLGKAILEQYTLRFDHRSTVHTYSNGRIPGEDKGVATLRCEAGYIATAQAYDTAIFNPR